MKISPEDHPHLLIVGDKIRERRKELGLTQNDLYIKSGITEKDIRKIENAQIDPGLMKLSRLAESLNMDIIELIPKNSCHTDNQKEDACISTLERLWKRLPSKEKRKKFSIL